MFNNEYVMVHSQLPVILRFMLDEKLGILLIHN